MSRAVIWGFVVLVGCSSPAEEPPRRAAVAQETNSATSTIPTISNLTYSPQSVPMQGTTDIVVACNYADADGDVTTIGVDIWNGAGERVLTQRSDVAREASGQAGGKLQITLRVGSPPSLLIGNYRFSVWLADALGQESNRLEGAFEAK